ncbi:hypothetical protein MA16_Dca029037 [Dendrobium catenatum]|uniref:Uncharacterized protein n=1 Tax=Dendrobium catenatum TaxID=906689 RepID=A0A2I0VED4_9ASPA|nr:hypothetical protein MA16_Dca029037 [Dendrobium catenatum]
MLLKPVAKMILRILPLRSLRTPNWSSLTFNVRKRLIGSRRLPLSSWRKGTIIIVIFMPWLTRSVLLMVFIKLIMVMVLLLRMVMRLLPLLLFFFNITLIKISVLPQLMIILLSPVK